MDYGRLLSRAWNVIWRHKIIWVFGFLAALGSGGGGANFSNRVNVPSGGNAPGNLPPELQRGLGQLFSNPSTIVAIVVALVVIGIVIGILVALLAALGNAGLVETVREADETDATSFRTGWNTGLRRMLPVFVVRLLLGLPSFLIVMAGVIPFLLSFIPLITQGGRGASDGIAAGIGGTALGCLLPAICVGVLLSIPLNVLQTLAVRAIVLEGEGIWGSIRRAWEVFTRNLGEIVVLWLIFLVLGIAVGIVIGLPIAALALAVIAPLAFLVARSVVFVIPLVLAALLVAVVSAAIRSIVEAFVSAVWTLAYRQFIGRAPIVTAPVPA